MSNAPVVSVTDELIAELEQYIGVPSIAALLAERAELKRDAERYRWLRDRIENKGDMVIAKVSEWSIESWSGDDPDAAIDAAMQS